MQSPDGIPTISRTYQYRKSANWTDVTFGFKKWTGAQYEDVDVVGGQPVVRPDTPLNVPLNQQISYVPPGGQNLDVNAQPIGYYIKPVGGTDPGDVLTDFHACSFPGGFDATLAAGQEIVIVYEVKIVPVQFTVKHQDFTSGAPLLAEDVWNLEQGDEKNGVLPYSISGYCLAGYTDDAGASVTFASLAEYDAFMAVGYNTAPLPANRTLVFRYAQDDNGNFIPDDQEAILRIHFYKAYVLGAELQYEVAFLHNYIGATQSFGQTTLRALRDPGTGWCYDTGTPDPVFSHTFPAGLSEETVTFYEDSNTDNIPDKDQARVTEYFVLYDNTAQTLLPSEVHIEYKPTSNYVETAPHIHNFVAVASWIGLEGAAIAAPPPLDETQVQNGISVNISPLGTPNRMVVFYYMADENGNKIPDAEEGSVVVHWQMVTWNNIVTDISRTLYGWKSQTAEPLLEQDRRRLGIMLLPNYLFDSTTIPGNKHILNFSTPGNEYTFVYREQPNAKVTILGYVDLDGNHQYSAGTDLQISTGSLLERFDL